MDDKYYTLVVILSILALLVVFYCFTTVYISAFRYLMKKNKNYNENPILIYIANILASFAFAFLWVFLFRKAIVDQIENDIERNIK